MTRPLVLRLASLLLLVGVALPAWLLAPTAFAQSTDPASPDPAAAPPDAAADDAASRDHFFIPSIEQRSHGSAVTPRDWPSPDILSERRERWPESVTTTPDFEVWEYVEWVELLLADGADDLFDELVIVETETGAHISGPKRLIDLVKAAYAGEREQQTVRNRITVHSLAMPAAAWRLLQQRFEGRSTLPTAEVVQWAMERGDVQVTGAPQATIADGKLLQFDQSQVRDDVLRWRATTNTGASAMYPEVGRIGSGLTLDVLAAQVPGAEQFVLSCLVSQVTGLQRTTATMAEERVQPLYAATEASSNHTTRLREGEGLLLSTGSPVPMRNAGDNVHAILISPQRVAGYDAERRINVDDRQFRWHRTADLATPALSLQSESFAPEGLLPSMALFGTPHYLLFRDPSDAAIYVEDMMHSRGLLDRRDAVLLDRLHHVTMIGSAEQQEAAASIIDEFRTEMQPTYRATRIVGVRVPNERANEIADALRDGGPDGSGGELDITFDRTLHHVDQQSVIHDAIRRQRYIRSYFPTTAIEAVAVQPKVEDLNYGTTLQLVSSPATGDEVELALEGGHVDWNGNLAEIDTEYGPIHTPTTNSVGLSATLIVTPGEWVVQTSPDPADPRRTLLIAIQTRTVE